MFVSLKEEHCVGVSEVADVYRGGGARPAARAVVESAVDGVTVCDKHDLDGVRVGPQLRFLLKHMRIYRDKCLP